MERIKSHISAGRVAWSDAIEPSPCCMCIRFSSHSFSFPTELTRIRYRSNYTEPSGDIVNRENLPQRTTYVSEKQLSNCLSLTTVHHVYEAGVKIRLPPNTGYCIVCKRSLNTTQLDSEFK